MQTLKDIPVVVMGLLVACILLVTFGPKDGQINLRTGELRYRSGWIPIRHTPMPLEKEWTSFGFPDEWETVVTYPLPSSNNPDGMITRMCEETVVWNRYDPVIGKMFADAIVSSIRTTHGEFGLPNQSSYLWMMDPTTGTVVPGCEVDDLDSSDPWVKRINAVLLAHGAVAAKH